MILFLSKSKKIRVWEKQGKLDNLIHALKYEMYDIRIKSAEALGRLGDKSTIPYLISGLDDEVDAVRIACKKSILQIDPSESNLKIIREKEEYWKSITEKSNTSDNTEYIFDKETYQWSGRFKRNMKWTNIIREQLRKPMRW
jgi:hypothetical protein